MKDLQKSQPCPHCNNFNNRGVSVDAVIIHDNKVLLIQRGIEPEKGKWATPGGYVEWNESTEEAMAREVKEETGLEVTNTSLVGVYSSPSRHPKQVINIVYLTEVEENTITPGDDAINASWFPFPDLPENLALDHKQSIQDGIDRAMGS